MAACVPRQVLASARHARAGHLSVAHGPPPPCQNQYMQANLRSAVRLGALLPLPARCPLPAHCCVLQLVQALHAAPVPRCAERHNIPSARLSCKMSARPWREAEQADPSEASVQLHAASLVELPADLSVCGLPRVDLAGHVPFRCNCASLCKPVHSPAPRHACLPAALLRSPSSQHCKS